MLIMLYYFPWEDFKFYLFTQNLKLPLKIGACLMFLWQKAMAPLSVLLPGKFHWRRSLVGGSPWGRTESNTTERLHFHFLLSCIGEGNGNPLQCSCLENPRDGEAWWAAVYGVAQSRTQLKWLSSRRVTKVYYNSFLSTVNKGKGYSKRLTQSGFSCPLI